MIKINVKSITLNESVITAIAKSAQSPELQNLLVKEANALLEQTKPKIPYNIHSKKQHMRDLYEVSKPQKATFKVLGERYPSSKVKIKPRGKYKTYYAVVTAGKRLGKTFNYSNPSAIPYALETALRQNQEKIKNEAIDCLLKRINNLEKS